MSNSVTPWTVARQAPLPMGFTRQEYWSAQPFPSPGDLSNSGIEPRSPALQVDSLPAEPPGKPNRRCARGRMLRNSRGCPGIKCRENGVPAGHTDEGPAARGLQPVGEDNREWRDHHGPLGSGHQIPGVTKSAGTRPGLRK